MAGEWTQMSIGELFANFDARRVPASSSAQAQRRARYGSNGFMRSGYRCLWLPEHTDVARGRRGCNQISEIFKTGAVYAA